MYSNNYLGQQLRQSSIDNEQACFAIVDGNKQISYAEMFAAAENIAASFIKLGLKPGDRVAVQVDKSIESIQVYLAVILAGGVFLPLNTAYTPNELEYFLSDATPRIFICRVSQYDDLKKVAEKAQVPVILTLDAQGNGSLKDSLSYSTESFEAVPRNADDLASILYTSGTTGRSKGAMLTHRNIASNAKVLADHWQFTPQDRLIHALPLFHIHGLYVAINITLMAGSSVIFHKQFDAQAILHDMQKATVLMGVPTFYVRLLTLPDLDKESTKSMRLFVSGSAPLLAETHSAWLKQTGHAILERYGMTETNMNTSNPYHGERREGTVGHPLPGINIIVANPENGQPLPQGEMGSIEIKGPNVFSGYWNMPEKTAEEFRPNGYFITGDLGRFDEQGYLSIVGRSKDMIISGGYNVYPKEIELLIDDIDGVDESAVIGLPHPDFGEGVAAVVVLKPGAIVTQSSISDHLTDKLAKFKQPKAFFIVSELPRNTMGKVQKNILRDQFKETFTTAPQSIANQ